jgi:hypothetical protein
VPLAVVAIMYPLPASLPHVLTPIKIGVLFMHFTWYTIWYRSALYVWRMTTGAKASHLPVWRDRWPDHNDSAGVWSVPEGTSLSTVLSSAYTYPQKLALPLAS